MDGCLVQNTKTFSEARYYLNANTMDIFDHHSNIIAAALGLGKDLRVTKATAYNAIAVHWSHTDADTICLSLKEPLYITDGLDVVVWEGV